MHRPRPEPSRILNGLHPGEGVSVQLLHFVVNEHPNLWLAYCHMST